MPVSPDSSSRILVLGATGHLGRAIARGLLSAGYQVHGLARAASPATRTMSGLHWHYGDLGRMTDPSSWRDLAAGMSAVVNAAGALQDSPRDDLAAIHVQFVAALVAALDPKTLLVHISAPGVSPSASTAFYRTKAAGDAAVRGSRKWVILRPVLVVSPEAYGGTALLRALAAQPFAIPALNPHSLMQTVALDDVVAAVTDAVAGRIPPASDLVLAEPHPQPLADVLRQFRRWLGLSEAPVLAMPSWLGRATAFVADTAGALGWRSPLRSTALQVASEDVTGIATYPCRSLGETLDAMPATVQDRWFARAYLLKALAIVILSLFWIASSLIGLLNLPAATAVLTAAGFEHSTATILVIAGALADLALGVMAVVRKTTALALIGMIGLTAAYLAAATVFTPSLWLDPLGPLVKSVPAAMLALLMLAIEPER